MAKHKEWSEEEIKDAVRAYLEMQRLIDAGLPMVKKRFYISLSEKYGHSEGAFEYRAQNISHVLAMQGRRWIPCLVPAFNVGPNGTRMIETALAKLEDRAQSDFATTESLVQVDLKKATSPEPKGDIAPKVATVSVTKHTRDLKV
jgi:5-methylcytosine-specific restriction protein A